MHRAEMSLFSGNAGLTEMTDTLSPSESQNVHDTSKTKKKISTLVSCLHKAMTYRDFRKGELELVMERLFQSPQKENNINAAKLAQKLKFHLIHQEKHKDAMSFVDLYNKFRESSVIKNRAGIMFVMYELFDQDATRRALEAKKQNHRLETAPQENSEVKQNTAISSSNRGKPVSNSMILGTTSLYSVDQLSSGLIPQNRNAALKSIVKMDNNVPLNDPTAVNLPTVSEESSISHKFNHVNGHQSHQPRKISSNPISNIKEKMPKWTSLRKSSPSCSTSRALISTEIGLIRDLIFIFEGIDGTSIKFNSSSKQYEISQNIPLSMKQKALRLCGLGLLHKKIRSFCERRTVGLMTQSLKYALEKELREYYKLLASIQSQVQQHASETSQTTKSGNEMTLLKLTVFVFDCIPRMEVIAEIIDRCKNKSGGELCSVLHVFSESGDPCVSSLASTLLSFTAKPLYLMICQWILYGELEDPHSEFFIGNDMRCSKDHLWHSKYYISKRMLPSFLSYEQAEKILATGKNINFLKEICHYNKGYEGRESIKEILEKSPVELLFMEESGILSQSIEKGYETTSEMVLKVLIEDSKLLDHFKALKKYLLLGQGDFIQHLLELMEPELSKPASKLYNHTISAILESAIRSTTCQFEDEDIISRLDSRLLVACNKDDGWDVFCLDYKVSGPIGSVFTDDIMQGYNQMFNLLWRIKRMEMILSTLWKLQSTYFKCQRVIPELGSVLHRSQLLISEMIHFIHQTQYYIMFEATENAWSQLMGDVSKASDLDQVIDAHEKFLGILKARSLLVIESRELLNQLRGIFDSIIELRTFFIDLDKNISEELSRRRSNMSQKESRSIVFSSYVMQAKGKIETLYATTQDLVRSFLLVLNRHPDLSLQSLSFRLDFNEYYLRKDSRLSLPLTFHHRRLSSNTFSPISTSINASGCGGNPTSRAGTGMPTLPLTQSQPNIIFEP